MKKISAREIALSAVCCAFGTLFLTLGTYYTPLLYTGYLFAEISVMIVLSVGYFKGVGLCFIAISLLSLLFNGFNFFDTLPFIMFFGLHPIVNELQLKTKLNRWVWFAIKALWFDCALYVIWRFVFSMNTSLDFVDKYVLPLIAVAGTTFFLLYDYMLFRVRKTVNSVVKRYIRKD